MKFDLSIIIVNWNGRLLLKQCLDSIKAETKEMNYEIIVVDNGSKDGSAEYISNNYKEVKLIENHDNMGFAHGNNQGIAAAQGEYLLLLNSDTIIKDNAIWQCLKRIRQDKNIGVIGCKLVNIDGSLQYSCYNFNSLTNAVLFKTKLINLVPSIKRYKYEVRMTSFDYSRELKVDYVSGAFMMMPAKLIDQIGNLDETFFMYAEEADFCMRAKRLGYDILFYPAVSVIHLGGGSSKTITEITEKRRIISRLKFIRKHRGYVYYGIYRTMSAVNAFLKLVFSKPCSREIYKAKLSAIHNMKYE